MSSNQRHDDMTGLDVEKTKISRREFVTGAATAAAVAAAIPAIPLAGGSESTAEASVSDYHSGPRTTASFQYRINTAKAERINTEMLSDNGDAARFTDHSALWHKAV